MYVLGWNVVDADCRADHHTSHADMLGRPMGVFTLRFKLMKLVCSKHILRSISILRLKLKHDLQSADFWWKKERFYICVLNAWPWVTISSLKCMLSQDHTITFSLSVASSCPLSLSIYPNPVFKSASWIRIN